VVHIAHHHKSTGIQHIVERLPIDVDNNISIFESQILHCLGDGKTIGHAFGGDIVFSPHIEDHHKNKKTDNQVDGHPAKHDDESLPGGFTVKFPAIRRFFHLLFVHAFIDHPGNFDVSAEGQPANAVDGIAYFLFE